MTEHHIRGSEAGGNPGGRQEKNKSVYICILFGMTKVVFAEQYNFLK
jgi:hypothetical protein